jgi:REP-associated tyrosine transposase
MSEPEYIWRQLTPEQRAELLAWRKKRGDPWHSPPHRPNFGHLHFHITAACFEHQPIIGHRLGRMDDFARDLMAVFAAHAVKASAWCVLPNHYHALVEAPDVVGLLRELGLFHGRTSHKWNGEENARGRKVFFRCVERAMRSEGHFWATLNYVHHNPVHHGYVERWTDWPWSSAADYLVQTGPDEARRIWQDYPLRDYGKGWDDPGV